MMATAGSEWSCDIHKISKEDFMTKFEAEFRKPRKNLPASPQDQLHLDNGGKLAIQIETHRGDPLEDRVLFLMAQTASKVKSDRWKGQARYLTTTEDSDKREFEVQDFIRNKCRFTSNLREENFDKRFVSNKEGMKTFIKQFLKKQSNIAWIFFIGHGSRDGELCFAHEDRISARDVINFIKNTFDDQRAKEKFPSNVQVVFTQCYGHIHEPECNGKQNLYVYWLSSEDEPCTTSVFRMEDFASRIRESRIRELNMFGQIVDDIEDRRLYEHYGSIQDQDDPENNEQTALYPSVRRRQRDLRALCFCLVLVSIIAVVLLSALIALLLLHYDLI